MSEEQTARSQTTGLFEFRLVRGGPWIAARVFEERGFLRLEIDGRVLPEHWPTTDREQLYIAELVADRDPHRHPLLMVWLFGRPIDEPAYYYRLTLGRWARLAMPDHPAANPRRRIDLGTVPLDALI